MGSAGSVLDNLNDLNVVGPVHPRKWAFKKIPFAGESVTSWLLRAIRSNLANPTTIVKQVFDLDLSRLDLDFGEHPQVVRYISDRTGVPIEDILTLIHPLPSKILNSETQHFTNLIWKTPEGPRICPACLATDVEPYYRSRWRVGFISACEEHMCLLENRCPSCNSVIHPERLKWRESFTSCHNCGFDLSKIKPIFFSPNDANLERQKALFCHPYPFVLNKIYRLMWFFLNACSPSDDVFQHHPITTMERFLKYWASPTSKMIALHQPIVMFLLCDTAYSLLRNRAELEKFLITHHSSLKSFLTNAPYYCDCCGTSFPILSSLLSHLRSHTGEKPFKCEYCAREFSSLSPFTTHLQTHAREIASKRPISNVSPSQEFRLKQYSRISERENYFECEYCGRVFNTRLAWKIHLWTHAGVNPHQCSHCEQSYSSKQELRKHLLTHEITRPYRCNHCRQRFKRQRTLNHHIRCFHGRKL